MKKIVGGAMLLLCFGLAIGQDNAKPFTKEELLRLLKPAPGKRVEQGDLAGEIAARGIAFPADEKTLEEFRKVGARSFVIDAIKQAASPAIASSSDETRAPSDEEVKRWPLAQRAAYRASMFIQELPNFVVTEIVSRSVQTAEKKDWQPQDTLEVELTYSLSASEKARLVKINGRATTQSFESVAGATFSGEFGGLIGALVDPKTQAQFRELRRESFRGRQTALFGFTVLRAHSPYVLTDKPSSRKVTTGMQGTIWIDTETAQILRIESAAEEIPTGFPLTLSESAVEYDWVSIAGKKYFLPVMAEALLGYDATRFYQRNVTEFRDYRLFDTKMKILPEKKPLP